MKYFTIVALALMSLLLAAPANALADDATPRPEVQWPLAMRTITLETPAGGHGVRKFAREVDSELAGVKVLEHGVCKNRPNTTCVRVVSKHYGDTGWYAQTVFKDWNRRVIQINLDLPNDHPYAVIAHEFGHVLGLGHHAMEGVDGCSPNVVHFSDVELKVLRRAYLKRDLS